MYSIVSFQWCQHSSTHGFNQGSELGWPLLHQNLISKLFTLRIGFTLRHTSEIIVVTAREDRKCTYPLASDATELEIAAELDDCTLSYLIHISAWDHIFLSMPIFVRSSI